MNYQQLIETPCSSMNTMTYDAYRFLLLSSYRQVILMDDQQKNEKEMEDWITRQRRIEALESHILTLHAHHYYKRFSHEYQTQVAA